MAGIKALVIGFLFFLHIDIALASAASAEFPKSPQTLESTAASDPSSSDDLGVIPNIARRTYVRSQSSLSFVTTPPRERKKKNRNIREEQKKGDEDEEIVYLEEMIEKEKEVPSQEEPRQKQLQRALTHYSFENIFDMAIRAWEEEAEEKNGEKEPFVVFRHNSKFRKLVSEAMLAIKFSSVEKRGDSETLAQIIDKVALRWLADKHHNSADLNLGAELFLDHLKHLSYPEKLRHQLPAIKKMISAEIERFNLVEEQYRNDYADKYLINWFFLIIFSPAVINTYSHLQLQKKLAPHIKKFALNPGTFPETEGSPENWESWQKVMDALTDGWEDAEPPKRKIQTLWNKLRHPKT